MSDESKFPQSAREAARRRCQAATNKFDPWLVCRNREDLKAALDEIDRLEAMISSTLPFLKEAWKACFHGQEAALLSCEERGMGLLLLQFQQIADGKPVLPIGLVSLKECHKREQLAAKWAHDLLGYPNDLKEPFRQYVRPGETCAKGIQRAHDRVTKLESENAEKDKNIAELLAENTALRTQVAERDEAIEAIATGRVKVARSSSGIYKAWSGWDGVVVGRPTPLAAIQDARAKAKGGN